MEHICPSLFTIIVMNGFKGNIEEGSLRKIEERVCVFFIHKKRYLCYRLNRYILPSSPVLPLQSVLFTFGVKSTGTVK